MRRASLALVVALALVGSACAPKDGGPIGPSATGPVTKGGVVRWENTEFGFTGGFDPTGEYLGEAWGLYTNLLLRALMGYKHLPGADGNQVIPDLAAEMPRISKDGLTYTFTIRDGVKFGPPLNREITARDVEYAFRRIATQSLVAQYQNYYVGTIKGLELGSDPGPNGIPGIKVLDKKTIRFELTKPTGDFLYRLAMPATAPIPEEVAKCFTSAGDYGRYVISSSSYMLKGSQDLDPSSCGSMKPISGFDPTKELVLVRNPAYDQSTDQYRENNIDELDYSINTNVNDSEQKVIKGDIDFVSSPTPPTLRRFATDPALKDRLQIDSADRTWFVTMNLAVPPFDDIHVRKAVNLVMDKDGLRKGWGGPLQGDLATHIIPDTMLGGLLDNYDPYPSPDGTGDVAAAMEEMKRSKYDTNGDGKCDESPACQSVLQVSSNAPPNTDMLPSFEDSMSKLGMTMQSRELADSYTPIQTVSKQVAISIRPGWGKDFADPFTFVGFLFDGRNILCTGNSNYSLVGLTKAKAKECGIPYPAQPVPSVDKDIDACIPLQGQERLQCWADLDKKLMEDVVPWVPYLDASSVWATGSSVTRYVFDQFSATPAWSRVAIDAASQ
jgi:peptide/nickel transport system substrate-binding protein